MSSPTVPPPAPPVRGRWLRRLSYVAVTGIALVALAPFYTGSLLRGWVERALERELAVEARVQAATFRWPATLRLQGLELVDADGAPLARVDDLSARVELGPLLRGKIRAEAEIAYPELHLAQRNDGRWNWETVRIQESTTRRAPRDSDGAPPDVAVHLVLTDGHVRLHGAQGETTLSEVEAELDLAGLDRPAPFHLALDVRGPSGPGGSLRVEGELTAAADGHLGLETLSGKALLRLEGVEIEAFSPALERFVSVKGIGGRIDGRAELALGAGLALTGTSELTLGRLRASGPRTPEAETRVERIELRANASQLADGTGRQHLELRADSFLDLAYEGSSRLDAALEGEVQGQLELRGDLGRLTELARGWVPLQAGVAVQGKLEHQLDLAATLAEGEMRTVRVRTRGGLTGLSGQDAGGRALDLGGLARVVYEVEAETDFAQGTLSLPAFSLEAGPLSCRGRLEARGLSPAGAALELRSGFLRLDADLERLRSTLAKVIALEALPFGGHLEAELSLAGEAQSLDLDGRIQGSELVFGATHLARLDGQVRGRRSSDGAMAGTGQLQLGTLTHTLPSGEGLSIPGAAVTLSLQESVARTGEHSFGLETSDGALKLTWQGRSRREPGVLELRHAFRFDGRVARLAELGASFFPLRAGLEGDLRLQGELDTHFTGKELASARGRLEGFLTDLARRDEGGTLRPFEGLARATFAASGAYDAATSRAELDSLALGAGSLQLTGSARARGLDLPVPELEDCNLAIEVDLARVGAELAGIVDLGETKFGGQPLSMRLELSTREQRLEARGKLRTDALRLERARPAAPLELAALSVDFDLGYDLALGSLHIRRAEASSRTADLKLSGTLNELRTPARARGAMELEVSGELGRMLADSGLEVPESGRSTSGALSARYRLEGDRGSFRVEGSTVVRDFRLELVGEAPEAVPFVVAEPAITLGCRALVDLATLDVELTALELESGLARGGAQGRIANLRALTAPPESAETVRFENLNGELAYVPDRLGALLAPLLPGRLSGAEERRVTFTLSGAVRDFDLATLLAGAETRIDLGLGLLELPEIRLTGDLDLEARGDCIEARGDLLANEGSLKLDGILDLTPAGEVPPRTRLMMNARGVRADARLAPLLAWIHPVFQTVGAAEGRFEGWIGLTLDLRYDAPLTLQALEAGWKALPKEPIHGTGRLEFTGAALQGSPLLELLSDFGVDTSKTLDLRPLDFTIQKGRVSYARPWTWTLGGTETTFTGTLGLDESLDLSWNVPITDQWIERWRFLSALKGESLAIPLRGTARKPRLEADALLKQLASEVAKRELESRLGLGGGGGNEDPAEILARADKLWSEGQKSAAAPLYSRLREDFKLSLTYALNKDRIKDRAKYKDPPK